jgi:hypothetical protein
MVRQSHRDATPIAAATRLLGIMVGKHIAASHQPKLAALWPMVAEPSKSQIVEIRV